MKLEEAANLADAALRDQLLLQSTDAAAELAKLGERLAAELNQSHQELKSAKTDSDRAGRAAHRHGRPARREAGPAAAPGKNGPRS